MVPNAAARTPTTTMGTWCPRSLAVSRWQRGRLRHRETVSGGHSFRDAQALNGDGDTDSALGERQYRRNVGQSPQVISAKRFAAVGMRFRQRFAFGIAAERSAAKEGDRKARGQRTERPCRILISGKFRQLAPWWKEHCSPVAARLPAGCNRAASPSRRRTI